MRRAEVSLLGFTVAIDAPADIIEDLIDALLQRTVMSDTPGDIVLVYELRRRDGSYHVVRIDESSCELIDRAGSIDRAAALIADNLHPWLAEHHHDLLAVHAGVVEWNDTAIVVPGRSHSGKSSLIAALIQHGARYMSDEFALIDRDGNVHPYARHLSMRSRDGATSLISPSDFGAITAVSPVPVSVIVDTSYVDGACFEPEPVRGAAALLSIIDNTLVARSRPEFTMKHVAALSDHLVVLRSPRGEADLAAPLILEAAVTSESAAAR